MQIPVCWITNHGSQYLSAAEQSHLYIAYHQGFAKVIDRIRAKYKDVVLSLIHISHGATLRWKATASAATL